MVGLPQPGQCSYLGCLEKWRQLQLGCERVRTLAWTAGSAGNEGKLPQGVMPCLLLQQAPMTQNTHLECDWVVVAADEGTPPSLLTWNVTGWLSQPMKARPWNGPLPSPRRICVKPNEYLKIYLIT